MAPRPHLPALPTHAAPPKCLQLGQGLPCCRGRSATAAAIVTTHPPSGRGRVIVRPHPAAHAPTNPSTRASLLLPPSANRTPIHTCTRSKAEEISLFPMGTHMWLPALPSDRAMIARSTITPRPLISVGGWPFPLLPPPPQAEAARRAPRSWSSRPRRPQHKCGRGRRFKRIQFFRHNRGSSSVLLLSFQNLISILPSSFDP